MLLIVISNPQKSSEFVFTTQYLLKPQNLGKKSLSLSCVMTNMTKIQTESGPIDWKTAPEKMLRLNRIQTVEALNSVGCSC